MNYHTPGPWTAKEVNWAEGLSVKDSQDRVLAHTNTVRNINGIPLPLEQHIEPPSAKANARLMAAAPTLLAALQIIAETPCDHGPGFCPRDYARAALKGVSCE